MVPRCCCWRRRSCGVVRCRDAASGEDLATSLPADWNFSINPRTPPPRPASCITHPLRLGLRLPWRRASTRSVIPSGSTTSLRFRLCSSRNGPSSLPGENGSQQGQPLLRVDADCKTLYIGSGCPERPHSRSQVSLPRAVFLSMSPTIHSHWP